MVHRRCHHLFIHVGSLLPRKRKLIHSCTLFPSWGSCWPISSDFFFFGSKDDFFQVYLDVVVGFAQGVLFPIFSVSISFLLIPSSANSRPYFAHHPWEDAVNHLAHGLHVANQEADFLSPSYQTSRQHLACSAPPTSSKTSDSRLLLCGPLISCF